MLTINNIHYTLHSLLQLCEEKISSQSTPSWERDIYIFIREWLSDADYIEVKTSGSTGEPKIIRLQKKWLEYSASQTCKFFNLNSQSSALLCLPAAYIAGRMMIVRAFVSGMNLVTVEPVGNPFDIQSSTHPTERPLRAHRVAIIQSSNRATFASSPQGNHPINPCFDFTALTPFQLYQSLQTLMNKPLVKSIIVGGGEVSPSLEKEVQELPIDIFATYGMTETSSHIALRKVNGNERKGFYTILGDTTIGLDYRECLTIKNPYLFDGELNTSDLVEIIDEKSFRWLGRFDNVINSGGIKIMPEEIEKAISNIVPQSIAISSIPHNTLGEAVVLVVESAELTNDEKKSLLLQIKKFVHSYAIPKQIYSLSEIPRTPTGKMDRRAIKERLK